MNEDFTQRYKDFFRESPAGQHFIEKLEELINAQHQKAEDDPTLARDYTQRAKGVRETIAIINSLTAGVKKGTNTSK